MSSPVRHLSPYSDWRDPSPWWSNYNAPCGSLVDISTYDPKPRDTKCKSCVRAGLNDLYQRGKYSEYEKARKELTT